MLLIMYLAAGAQLGISALCMSGTSPYADCGAEKYAQRRYRRTIGQTLLAGGILWAFLALVGSLCI